jgi:hypothetical protein
MAHLASRVSRAREKRRNRAKNDQNRQKEPKLNEPERKIDLSDRLKADLAAAEQARQTAELALGEATLDLNLRDSPEANAAFQSACSALQASQVRVEGARHAIVAFERRHAAQLEREREAREAASWAKIRAARREAAGLAKEVENSLRLACKNFRELMDLVNEVSWHLPVSDGTAFMASPISEPNLLAYFRLEIRRRAGRNAGSWARTWLEEETKIPAFVYNVDQGFAWMLKMAPPEDPQERDATPAPLAELAEPPKPKRGHKTPDLSTAAD